MLRSGRLALGDRDRNRVTQPFNGSVLVVTGLENEYMLTRRKQKLDLARAIVEVDPGICRGNDRARRQAIRVDTEVMMDDAFTRCDDFHKAMVNRQAWRAGPNVNRDGPELDVLYAEDHKNRASHVRPIRRFDKEHTRTGCRASSLLHSRPFCRPGCYLPTTTH